MNRKKPHGSRVREDHDRYHSYTDYDLSFEASCKMDDSNFKYASHCRNPVSRHDLSILYKTVYNKTPVEKNSQSIRCDVGIDGRKFV